MYFCYGWPKVLALEYTGKQDVVAVLMAGDYLVLVSTDSIQIWSGGQHRVCLGTLKRDKASVKEDGLNRRATWCKSKRLLAVLTYNNILHIYGVHISKEPAVNLQSPPPGVANLKRSHIYLQTSITLAAPQRLACHDLVCDSRAVAVAFSDGTFQAYSWNGTKKGGNSTVSPLMQYMADFALGRGGSGSFRGTGSGLGSALGSGLGSALRTGFPPLGPTDSLYRGGSFTSNSPLSVPGDVRRDNGETLVEMGRPPTAPATAAQAQAAAAAAVATATASGPARRDRDRERRSTSTRARSVSRDREQARPPVLPGTQPRPGNATSGIHQRTSSTSSNYEGQLLLACVDSLDYCPVVQLLAVVLSDGRCAICKIPESGLSSVDQLIVQHWVGGLGSGATCIRIGGYGKMVAVGLTSGEVVLYRLFGISQDIPLRVISLADWGYEPEVTGSVADIAWSPDNRALAVGWRRSGLGLWSVSGCRLLCSLRQTPRTPKSGQPQVPRPKASNSMESACLECGVSCLAWGVEGYKLVVTEASGNCQVLELTLAKSLPNSHRLIQNEAVAGETGPSWLPSEVHILQGEDRLLLVTEGGESRGAEGLRHPGAESSPVGALTLHHLKPPAAYIAANWPLIHAAVSPDGADLAVAGVRGLCLYSRRSGRWRLFGDISQEREISVQGLSWLPRIVVLCATRAPDDPAAELLFYPRYYLDATSLLARYPLSSAPIAVDALQEWVIVVYDPMRIDLLHVRLTGPLTPMGQPKATVTLIMSMDSTNVGLPIRAVTLVDRGMGLPPADATIEEARLYAPRQCLLLKAGGALTMLDMVEGTEHHLTEEVESYWLPASASALSRDDARPAAKSQSAGLRMSPSHLSRYSTEAGPTRVRGSRGPSPTRGSGNPADAGGGYPWTRDPSPAASRRIRDPSPGGSGSDRGRGRVRDRSPFGLPPIRVPASKLSVTEAPGPLRRHPADVKQMRKHISMDVSTLPPYTTGTALVTRTPSPAPRRNSVEDRSLPTDGASPRVASGSEAAPREASLPGPFQGGGGAGSVEIPWWTYGARGMQLWFPSALKYLTDRNAAPPVSQNLDPELEFDPEVYPIGVSLAEGSIVGVTQRVVRNWLGLGRAETPSAHAQLPCFHPIPGSQPVLPCLLRRLLQGGRREEALSLALHHSSAPHFARSLEWLLFTCLDANAEGNRVSPIKQRDIMRDSEPGPSTRKPSDYASPLLLASADLIRQFPQFQDIVVSVARKTDAQMWPALFAAVGPPSALLDELLDAGQLTSAACCLLIVDRIEGAQEAHRIAIILIKMALAEGMYLLAAELLRFIVPPVEDTSIAGQMLSPGPNRPSARAPKSWLGGWFQLSQDSSASAPEEPPPSSSVLVDVGPGMPGDPEGGKESSISQAWKLIGAHAWRLLETGRLRALSRLSNALVAMGASLGPLMAAYPPPQPMQTSGLSTLTAYTVVSRELVDESGRLDAEHDSVAEACAATGAIDWCLAFAIAKHDDELIKGFSKKYPNLWEDFLIAAGEDPHLTHLLAPLMKLNDSDAGCLTEETLSAAAAAMQEGPAPDVSPGHYARSSV